MGEDDWLERGHGGGEGLKPLIKGSSDRAPDRVSIRGVLRGTTPPPKPRRRTKALVGWLLYCATAVGGTAAAFTVRDTLFPSLGAPTKRGVWATSNVDTTLTPLQHGSTTSMSRDAVVLEAAMQEEIIEGTPTSSVDAATVPTEPAAEHGPITSVDNLDPARGKGPSTVTIVDEGPASGPGPGTTIDEHPSDTSPPTTIGEPTSPLTPDPSVTTTTVDPDPSGKGGGGGGGKGKGGGDHTTLP